MPVEDLSASERALSCEQPAWVGDIARDEEVSGYAGNDGRKGQDKRKQGECEEQTREPGSNLPMLWSALASWWYSSRIAGARYIRW
jgi:hypothetical protein